MIPDQFLAGLFGCLAKVTEFVVLSVWVLFCIMIWTIVRLFRCLNSSVIQFAVDQPTELSEAFVTKQLNKWRRQHQLATQLIENVNSFFGGILVMIVTHSFVTLIVDSFEITIFASSFNIFYGLIFLGRFSLNVLRFSTICYGCWLVDYEVRTSVHGRELFPIENDIFSLVIRLLELLYTCDN